VRARPFLQVDVFGHRPLVGNPVAVVLDADGIGSRRMQNFARWTNLSETVFLLPPTAPDADYRARIFTLSRELPFAGHPTLGACHAWLANGGRLRADGSLVQECGVGHISHRRDDVGRLSFQAQPLIRSGPVDPKLLEGITAALALPISDVVDARWADNGPGWVGVLLADATQVLELEPDPAAVRQLLRGHSSLDVGILGPHQDMTEYAFEVRALYTDHHGEVREDPVTGSLNASLAAWMLETGRTTSPYTGPVSIRRKPRCTIRPPGP
jgi:PhzF family phenazine biosynthesis protein